MILQIILEALIMIDIITTEIALKKGGSEANLLMKNNYSRFIFSIFKLDSPLFFIIIIYSYSYILDFLNFLSFLLIILYSFIDIKNAYFLNILNKIHRNKEIDLQFLQDLTSIQEKIEKKYLN